MSSSDREELPLEFLHPLMTDVERCLRSYCYLPSPEAYVVMTAWIATTYVVDLLETAPGLVVTSPLGRSARSRMLEIVGLLAHRSIVTTAAEAQPVSLRRHSSVTSSPPTLFIDDADVIFKPGVRGSKVGLRQLIDSCHTRGLFALRVGGEEFRPFAITCLVATDRLPPSVEDRAVVIRIDSGGEDQKLGWYRRRDASHLAMIAGLLASWAEQNAEEIAKFITAWVEGDGVASSSRLKDHAAETWEPLFAIADLAGHGWLTRVVDAAEALNQRYQDEKRQASISERLLRDASRLLADRAGFIGSSELTELLAQDELSDWAIYGLTPTRLARTLRGLGLESRRDRSGRRRGFQTDELRKVIAQHLDSSDASDASDTSQSPDFDSREHTPERRKSA